MLFKRAFISSERNTWIGNSSVSAVSFWTETIIRSVGVLALCGMITVCTCDVAVRSANSAFVDILASEEIIGHVYRLVASHTSAGITSIEVGTVHVGSTRFGETLVNVDAVVAVIELVSSVTRALERSVSIITSRISSAIVGFFSALVDVRASAINVVVTVAFLKAFAHECSFVVLAGAVGCASTVIGRALIDINASVIDDVESGVAAALITRV